MAINKNHEFEELDGVKCGVVERQVPPSRVAFLKSLLEHNGYTVIVVPSPPPKAAPAKTVEEIETATPPPGAQTFTIGVTDYTFNTINAIFGRALKTKDGKIVTLAYWKQEAGEAQDEIPYFQQQPG